MIEEIRKLLGEGGYLHEDAEFLLKKIAVEIGKVTVPKKEFNAKAISEKSLREQLLKTEAEKCELKKAIERAEVSIAKLTSEQKKNNDKTNELNSIIEALRIEHALEIALIRAGVRNLKAVKALIDPLQVSFGLNNEIVGLNLQLTRLKKTDPYLFKAVSRKNRVQLAIKGATKVSCR